MQIVTFSRAFSRSMKRESTNFSACSTQSNTRSSSALAWLPDRLLLVLLTNCKVASRYTASTASCKFKESLLYHPGQQSLCIYLSAGIFRKSMAGVCRFCMVLAGSASWLRGTLICSNVILQCIALPPCGSPAFIPDRTGVLPSSSRW